MYYNLHKNNLQKNKNTTYLKTLHLQKTNFSGSPGSHAQVGPTAPEPAAPRRGLRVRAKPPPTPRPPPSAKTRPPRAHGHRPPETRRHPHESRGRPPRAQAAGGRRTEAACRTPRPGAATAGADAARPGRRSRPLRA
ncbi:unnamed protein product [Urochloa humidicola]